LDPSTTVVVALGGNAILQPNQRGTVEEQRANVSSACEQIARIIQSGYRVVVTHGNGPQVGNILLQNEEAAVVVPPMPLDVCGAESQGLIGYLIQQSLGNALRREGLERPVVAVVTQVVVDPHDPAFHYPTKPVGPFYSGARAKKLMDRRGWVMKEDANRGWRRVVASPMPRSIVERESIRCLLREGAVVIACGGGGIPVYLEREGHLVGVEAVIDKDLAAQVLASEVGAGTLLIATDVSKVALHYGTPRQRLLDSLSLEQAREYLSQGHFAEGSMKPKILASLRFLEAGGEMAAIGPLHRVEEMLKGMAGTSLTRDGLP